MTEINIPEMTERDMAFGNIKHMPDYYALPEDFQRHRGNVFCEAISSWFFSGAKFVNDKNAKLAGIQVKIGYASNKPTNFIAKPGVDAGKALRAIRAILASWAPKHEHKEGGAAYLLSQWFDVQEVNAAEKAA